MMDWHNYFLTISFLIAQKSPDPKTKHGCIIVDKNNRVISLGYNGPVSGMKDDNLVPWYSTEKYNHVIHAEENAILFAKRDLEGCRLYVTGPPCCFCFKLIAQSGIKEIFHAGVKSSMIDETHEATKSFIAQQKQIKVTDLSDSFKPFALMLLKQAHNYLKERS
jgi:dCMP deaminase